MNIRRITITGTPGSGKSTLAVHLGTILNIPHYHMDQILWKENWVLRDTQEFLDLSQVWIDKDSWVIEGSSIKSMEMRYGKSDMVIHLTPPRVLCIFRVFKRLWFKDPRVQDKPKGCHEKIDLDFLKYVWRYERKANVEIQRLHKKYPKVPLFYVRNRRQLNAVLKGLGSA